MAGRAGGVAGRVGRVKPLRHARALVLGLLADLPGKNCWTVAEHAGQVTPDSLQYLLAAVVWTSTTFAMPWSSASATGAVLVTVGTAPPARPGGAL